VTAPNDPPPPLDPARSALFADLDGTLTPIRPRPGDVGPDPDRARLLDALSARLGGALAVVSGRALDDIDRVLDGRVRAVAAVHGLVRRRADGGMVETAAHPVPDAARARVRAFLPEHPAVKGEDKIFAVTLHFRADPGAADACAGLMQRLAHEFGLVVQAGDQVVELRAPGPNKGDAVAAFMAEAPFAGRAPVFIGDDLTDEDGFAAAARLGGHGVIVGPRRPTCARFALVDVDAALAWIASSL
jgi:trehalose 6-phosphate phosphatase